MKVPEQEPIQISFVRVLIVDDLEAWREFVISRLQAMSDLHIVGTASDGVEAVRKAAELQPDLILLDVRLPRLNGIEAARQIRELAPNCKILFLSAESDASVVQAAFDAGASGFVLKLDAAKGLLAGMASVLLGRAFFSRGLMGPDGRT
jgi:two-component system NarL family response regulator